MPANAADWLCAWDSHDYHRTGTDGDEAGAAWLAGEVAALGVQASSETFALDRIDPVDVWLELDGARIDAVPVFDAPPTGSEGVVGTLGEAGSDAGEPSPRVPWLLVGLVFLLWMVTCFFQVNASDKGVTQRFGRYSSVWGEGVGIKFPWPIEKVTKVNVSAVNSVEYRSRMLTADVNLVEIRAAIQYQNADPVIVAEPSLNLSEVARIGEVGSQDINSDTGFPAETVRQRLHASAVARH